MKNAHQGAHWDDSSSARAATAEVGTQADFQRTVESLGAVLDGAPDPVLVIAPGKVVRYANHAVERVFGWRPEELLGESVAPFVVDPEALERVAAEVRAGRPVHSAELEVLHRDGSRRWLSLSASPLRLADRSFAGAVIFARDETESRRTRLELARKNAELEQTVRAVSHDLRSPLVAVLGFSRLLREDYGEKLDAKASHFLERIEQAARTMELLIRDFLEFSRIGHDREASRAWSDPQEVLLQLQAELKPRLDAQRVRLDLPSEVPLVHCERTHLYQILSNLVGNALEHMGPCASPCIRVRIFEEPTHHHITVADNGRGIDPAQHERIFEIFHALKRNGTSAGTGMGLAIVRKIAEVHGGAAWVESTPGAGSVFHVTLARP